MIGVIGLGLIGGSMAKAIHQNTDQSVYGYDLDETVTLKAKLVNAVEDVLTMDMLPHCDMVIVALYPEATLEFIRKHQGDFKEGAIVLDCCGVKEIVCREGEKIAKKNNFIFMGGHPMAGLEHAGFEYAKRALFDNASMVLTPAKKTPIEVVEKVKKLCESIGFSNIQIATPEEHDRMIAFTSQLAHVVSSAYIKSPTAVDHRGFSAGSYKDLSRVAKLNEDMWTELFLDNPKNLANEVDGMIERLSQYRDAIKEGDEEVLRGLLRDGRLRKEEIDKEKF